MKSCLFNDGEPIKSTMLLCDQSLFKAGRLCAASILQGGSKPDFLSDWCYEFIIDQKIPSPKHVNPPHCYKQLSHIKKVFK